MTKKVKTAMIAAIVSIVIILAIAFIAVYRKRNMKTSKKGIQLIKDFEGLRLTSYRCPADVWTIGYGHTANVTSGQTITETQAEQLLKDDLKKFETAVNSENLNINQNQFDSLVSFAYNVGESAFRKSTLLQLVKNNPKDSQIKSEFMRWVHIANGQQLAGLVRRREAESNLYFS